MQSMDPGLIGLFSGSIALVALIFVPIFLHFSGLRRDRTLTHIERLKAIESGHPLPQPATPEGARIAAISRAAEEEGRPAGPAGLARKCFSTAVWVAFWGFGATFLIEDSRGHSGVTYAIAASVGAIGVASVICGTVLAARIPTPGPRPAARPGKPRVEDDAYDVVSSRG